MTVKELAALIKKAQQAYYNGDEPIMSDAEFDKLWDELKEKDPENPIFSKVGSDDDSGFKKVTHRILMGSQNKANTVEEMNDWIKRYGSNVIGQFKMDGISLELNYDHGTLISGITRGDGHIGDDITPNVEKMKGVPKKIDKNFTGAVRGEILLSKKTKNKFYPDAKNCRNQASGLSKRLDGEGCEHLTVVCYDAQYLDSKKFFKTQKELQTWLENQGFEVAVWKEFDDLTGIDSMDYLNEVFDNLDKIPYDIDGIVWKQQKIDMKDITTNLRPKTNIALKPKNVEVKTKLLDIAWDMGGNGTLTPIAILKPVEILGSTVSRASLVHLGEIIDLGIEIGDDVIVTKTNMIIPKILRKAN